MKKINNTPIPSDKIYEFHKILCETGGRYLHNPYYNLYEDQYRVSYIPGDYKQMNERLNRLLTDIVEVKNDQWWKRMCRKYLKINC